MLKLSQGALRFVSGSFWVEEPQVGEVVEDRILGGKREFSGYGDCSDPSVGFVALGTQAMPVVNAPSTQSDVSISDVFQRRHYSGACYHLLKLR
ncbi:MAG: hypothetical protein OXF00_13245 [bacterium]|nr:hypothetical protein [bacterium]